MVKKGRIVTFFSIIVVLAVVIGFTINPIVHKIRLGLDLQGGFEVLYDVQPLKSGQKINNQVLQSTVSALQRRINKLGVSEPQIQIEGKNHIRVDLAGVNNQQKARKMLSTSAHLSFRDYQDHKLLDGSAVVPGSAKVGYNQLNQPIVTLKLKNASKFASVTKKVLNMAPNNVLVIWMDYHKGESYLNQVGKKNHSYISAPSVNSVLNTNSVEIDGTFTLQQAQTLADLLNAGALPVKMKEIYSTSVGAQFGQNSLTKTVTAGFIGIAAIFLFMLLFYRFGGLIAVVSLIVYTFLVLLVFELLNAVLTLPGIAALILGIGMAVDANIITLERFKEEIRTGKSILSAFKAGNRRSFSTIFDSNLTTILVGVVMFIFGTSDVKGFAVMLIVSIVISFITAVYGSRLLLSLWINSRALNKKPGFFGVKKGDISEL